jgi:hypothetical protein
MGLTHRIFNVVSWIATAAVLYTKIQELNQAKSSIYAQLPPNLQAEWVQTFGDPTNQTVNTPNPMTLLSSTVSKMISTPQTPPVATSTPTQVAQVAAGV